MTEDIPIDLLSDHLFLLVGTNPLPDWVAAQLLVRDRARSQIYLIHSNEYSWVANSLERSLTGQGFRRPRTVGVDNPFSAAAIRRAINTNAEKIEAGVVGLNYTGGTKVMTVHAYRAVVEDLPDGLPPPVFSYLEADACVLRFDPSERYPLGRAYAVGHRPIVARTLEELSLLQGGVGQGSLHTQIDTKADEAAVLLARVHETERGPSIWRKQIDRIVLTNGEKFKSERELRDEPLNIGDNFPHILKALTLQDLARTPTLGDIVDSGSFGFTGAAELAEWLHGKWLEHYVLKILKDHRDEFRLKDCARNVEKAKDYWSDKFELDVAALHKRLVADAQCCVMLVS